MTIGPRQPFRLREPALDVGLDQEGPGPDVLLLFDVEVGFLIQVIEPLIAEELLEEGAVADGRNLAQHAEAVRHFLHVDFAKEPSPELWVIHGQRGGRCKKDLLAAVAAKNVSSSVIDAVCLHQSLILVWKAEQVL